MDGKDRWMGKTDGHRTRMVGKCRQMGQMAGKDGWMRHRWEGRTYGKGRADIREGQTYGKDRHTGRTDIREGQTDEADGWERQIGGKDGWGGRQEDEEDLWERQTDEKEGWEDRQTDGEDRQMGKGDGWMGKARWWGR